MKKTFLLIGMALLMGCTSKTTDSLSSIAEAGTDSVTMQKVNNIELWCSDVMTICDSCLVIADRCQTERLYLFQLSDFQFIQSFGSLGRGPLDCIFPFFLAKDTPKQNEFSIYDPQLARSKTFSICHSQKDSIISLVEEGNIPTNHLTSTDMAQMGGNYYGTQDEMLGLFFIHSTDKDTTTWIPYPSAVAGLSDKMPETARQSRSTVNFQQKKICVAMRYYNQLYLYDMDGQLLKGGRFGEEMIPASSNGQIDASARIFFTQITSTEKYIYLILSNQVYGKGFSPDLSPSEIAIFDWNLNHVKTLQTNVLIHSMIIDSVYHRMIVLGFNKEGNPELYFCPWKE